MTGAHDAGTRFQNSPGTIFVAEAVFQTFSFAVLIRAFRSFANSLPVIGMNLLHRGTIGQLLYCVTEDSLVRRAAVKTLAMAIDDGDHVCHALGHQVKQFFALSQPTSHPLELQMLIRRVNVE
jgi:hypothetical protein